MVFTRSTIGGCIATDEVGVETVAGVGGDEAAQLRRSRVGGGR